MSTLKASTVETSSGGAVTLTKQSACKAWMAIDQIPASQAIHSSFNISSIADNTTGTTDFNFTNNFSSTSYAATASSHYSGIASHASRFAGDKDESSQTTSSNVIQCYVNAGSTGDGSTVTWHGMGEVA